MEDRSGSSGPDQDEIAELRARADAGDRNAAGRLGELLAKHGDREGALRVWARAHGDTSPTTRRLADLLAERGDLAGAVEVWTFSDAVRQNPAGFHAEYLNTLNACDRLDEDDPEDWAFIEGEELARLLAEGG
ncbi:hypothetical protein Sipo8835_27920 [Streptomyces ipomoeae]|uniref:Tetratricopeptide repeat protein n=2 Tax=Streptomyces ipomoeae TaxID=103232 RepID=L1KV50_9ACTN|nr:hypothetical protein [Streptomyces ipomoeae]EKX64691.1 hypothetical protein STRIP9103_02648 [Streptomyces ipomoeae 91-03]TQE27343.1 hypothetical protein Sipo8835_27920 [Streptomyces ipomoeae]